MTKKYPSPPGAANAAQEIVELVEKYVATHPDHIYEPGTRRDVCSLALSSMQPWLIGQFEEPSLYWVTMLSAAKHWFRLFDPDVLNSETFKYFCYSVETIGPLGNGGDWYELFFDEYKEWVGEIQRTSSRDMANIQLPGEISDLPEREREHVLNLVAEKMALENLRDIKRRNARRNYLWSQLPSLPYMPFTSAIFRAAKVENPPPLDEFVCQLANEMKEKLRSIEGNGFPCELLDSLDQDVIDGAVNRSIAANILTGYLPPIQKWQDAATWFDHVESIIDPTRETSVSFESQLMRVSTYINHMHGGISPVEE